MFYPLFCLLYLITKSMFRIIDAMLLACKVLCGLESVSIDDQATDFLSFLLSNEKVGQGFRVCVILGVILVFAFCIAAIIRTCVSEKSQGTPGQLAVKAVKILLEFLFVPFVMFTIIGLTNVFMGALYEATSVTESPQLGNFLCGAFSQDGLKEGVDPFFYLDPGFDYTDTGRVFDFCQYDDFDFFFSWVTGIGIILALGTALLSFIDRAISIVLLFIAAPISISTAMIDDGAHFKLWRDQILVKFLTGYGIIIGINLYAILVSAISSPTVQLVTAPSIPDNSIVSAEFLDYLVRIAIIMGGAFSLQRIMALIGNLVQAGAGSNELREANAAASSLGGSLKGVAKGIVNAPLKVGGFINDAAHIGIGGAIAHSLGWKASADYRNSNSGGGGGGTQGGGNHNGETPKNETNNNVQQIIADNKGDDKKKNETKNDGNQQTDEKKPTNKTVSDIIGGTPPVGQK